jgi:hypothetical protein
LQTGNLSEIDSIACNDDCAVCNGCGGYSQILAAGAKALSLQIFENSNGCRIKFEDVQLRQIVDRLAKPAAPTAKASVFDAFLICASRPRNCSSAVTLVVAISSGGVRANFCPNCKCPLKCRVT